MTHIVLPPTESLLPDGTKLGGWWKDEPDGRILCELCPRACRLKPGDRGFCFVRENRDGKMVLDTYGRSTGFCIDPIEKKPLNHFYPGTSVLSFGTAGCNLACKFCQNWESSKSREVSRLSEIATPEMIAEAARQHGCHSVAFTYNDPVVWAEYAMDTARACHAAGIKTVAVTAGYISDIARPAFFADIDAANVDLKAFTEDFYYKQTYSHLQPVLDTLKWLHDESDVWVEITNLVIPHANDSREELSQMCDWILAVCGDQVPIHFSAFHPDFRLTDRESTPPETLAMARDIALAAGIRYAYTGNVNDAKRQSTYCPNCGTCVIERDWYQLGSYQLRGNECAQCGQTIAGRFAPTPGNWGRRRQPVQIADFKPSQNTAQESASQEKEKPMPTSSSPTTAPVLDDRQRAAVLVAASQVVADAVFRRTTDLKSGPFAQFQKTKVLGTYVTLKRAGRLRACCGFLGKMTPLPAALADAGQRSATQDPRFPEVSPTELPYLHLDVWLLSEMLPMKARGEDRVAAVEIGKHGLHIRQGKSSGLLLPGVAVEQGYDSRQFLMQVCRKAGLQANAWKSDATQLMTFEGTAIEGGFDSGVLSSVDTTPGVLFRREELQALFETCRNNVIAQVQGATPHYYVPGIRDGSVAGISMEFRLPGLVSQRLMQMSLRPGIPLQSTLFNQAEAIAKHLVQCGANVETLAQLQLGVTIISDVATHGTVAQFDSQGVDPKMRAIVVLEGNKSAWVFDPALPAKQLVATAAKAAAVTRPEGASVFSMTAETNEAPLVISSVPQPPVGSEVRPCAKAGQFYPADASQLAAMVDGFLSGDALAKESWPAIMVPHAGLQYSGQLAADVFRRVEIPSRVIVIGPKHTARGVDWAVAPHETWELPGGGVASDVELARALADKIPGLQLDAAAHADEHAIEVELPFLARLAPRSKVVGIALAGCQLSQCQQFAAGLAELISAMPEPPLIVISSDMNHFATDEENRRLDEMALAAMETLDPGKLLSTCRDQNISMCGVIPAVIVMETLRRLGKLTQVQRVGYATSADVSGDKSRVVGYAGMLLGGEV